MPKSIYWLVPILAIVSLALFLRGEPAEGTEQGLLVEDFAPRRPLVPEEGAVLVDIPNAPAGEARTAPTRQGADGSVPALESDEPEGTSEGTSEEAREPANRPGSLRRLHAQLFEHPSDHAEAPGKIWDLGPGLTSAGLAFDNDSASVAVVPEGVSVTLFVDGGGEGRRVVLPPGRHELHAIGFGDEVSSVRVSDAVHFDPATPRGPERAVRLHQHLPREGELGEAWNLRLRDGQSTRLFRSSDGHFLNNEASAAWIPPGYEVTLFENGNGLGRALVLGPGFHELLPYDFNDQTSSARVRRTP